MKHLRQPNFEAAQTTCPTSKLEATLFVAEDDRQMHDVQVIQIVLTRSAVTPLFSSQHGQEFPTQRARWLRLGPWWRLCHSLGQRSVLFGKRKGSKVDSNDLADAQLGH